MQSLHWAKLNYSSLLLLLNSPPLLSTHPIGGGDGVGAGVEVTDWVDMQGEVVQEPVAGVIAEDLTVVVTPHHGGRRIRLNSSQLKL